MDFVFKVLPPSVAIVLLLSPEYGEFLVHVLIDQKIETWGEDITEDAKNDIKAFALALADCMALFASWLMTTATTISVAISASKHGWVVVFGVGAIVIEFVGLAAIFMIIRTAKISSYVSKKRRRFWILSLPGSGTKSSVLAYSCMLAVVNIALIAAAAVLT